MNNYHERIKKQEEIKTKFKLNHKLFMDRLIDYLKKEGTFDSEGFHYKKDSESWKDVGESFYPIFELCSNYARDNYLLIYPEDNCFSNGEFVVKYNDHLIEFSSMSGQGTVEFARLIKDTKLNVISIENIVKNKKIDTTSKRLEIFKEDFLEFLSNSEYLELTKQEQRETIEKIFSQTPL